MILDKISGTKNIAEKRSGRVGRDEGKRKRRGRKAKIRSRGEW